VVSKVQELNTLGVQRAEEFLRGFYKKLEERKKGDRRRRILVQGTFPGE